MIHHLDVEIPLFLEKQNTMENFEHLKSVIAKDAETQYVCHTHTK